MTRTILAILALALAVPAYVCAAETPPAEKIISGEPAASPSPVLSYVPDDADAVIFVRVSQLVRSSLWKKFATPDAGLYGRIRNEFPINLDFEKDVEAAACIVSVACKDGRPDAVLTAWVFEMTRDTKPADLLRNQADSEAVPGATLPAYAVGPEDLLVVPSARMVIVASREFLPVILATPAKPRGKADGTLPAAALAARGELTLAARISPILKEGLRESYEKMRRDLLRPSMTAGEMMEFSVQYNLLRVALEAETVTGSLDVSRDADSVRLEVQFASAAMAPFLKSVLQAMADPVQMCLPAMVGGAPLLEAPEEPFYKAAADGRTVRLTMNWDATYRLVERLAGASRLETARDTSAAHLRAVGKAVQAYVAANTEWPKTWSDLQKANLIPDPIIFENPALETHLPAGDYELVPLTRESADRKPWEKVVAYEVYPKDSPPAGLNVLFADGQVQYIDLPAFHKLYARTLESLRR